MNVTAIAAGNFLHTITKYHRKYSDTHVYITIRSIFLCLYDDLLTIIGRIGLWSILKAWVESMATGKHRCAGRPKTRRVTSRYAAQGERQMSRDLELPDTELTILESIRNLLRAWFIIWLVLTLLGTTGLIILCAEILTRG